jgi:hypothetical protein
MLHYTTYSDGVNLHNPKYSVLPVITSECVSYGLFGVYIGIFTLSILSMRLKEETRSLAQKRIQWVCWATGLALVIRQIATTFSIWIFIIHTSNLLLGPHIHSSISGSDVRWYLGLAGVYGLESTALASVPAHLRGYNQLCREFSYCAKHCLVTEIRLT